MCPPTSSIHMQVQIYVHYVNGNNFGRRLRLFVVVFLFGFYTRFPISFRRRIVPDTQREKRINSERDKEGAVIAEE